MTLAARLGIVAAALVLIVLATGIWFFWRYPLSIYARMNTRALASAGFTREDMSSPIGKQSA